MKSQDQKLYFSLWQQHPAGYEEVVAVQWLKAGSGWVGGSRGEGLAGAGWHAATTRAACSWEECSLLKAQSLLFLKASALAGGSKCPRILPTLHWVHCNQRKNIGTGWRGKASGCSTFSPPVAAWKHSDQNLPPCKGPCGSLQPFSCRCLVSTDRVLPRLWYILVFSSRALPAWQLDVYTSVT